MTDSVFESLKASFPTTKKMVYDLSNGQRKYSGWRPTLPANK